MATEWTLGGDTGTVQVTSFGEHVTGTEQVTLCFVKRLGYLIIAAL